jgi:hypothetical protein
MFKRKVNLYAVLFMALTACTKQEITPNNQLSSSDESNFLWWPRKNQNPDAQPISTLWGLTQEPNLSQINQQNMDYSKKRMAEAGVQLTRISIAIGEDISNVTIDNYLADGYNVQILANWNAGTNGYRGFPTINDTALVRSRAEAFFKYYAPYKKQIPFVAIENEWDWEAMHGASVADYLTELAIITDAGHKYGFKVADGGITSTSLQRWTYSQLSGQEQEEWGNDYWIGINGGYSYTDLMNIVNTFIDGVKNIAIDYSNVHWCNTTQCSNGFATAIETYADACNKNASVCNEFYIRTNSFGLFDATLNEVKGNVLYALAYSGTNNDGKAIWLTDEMLNDMN